MTSFASSPRHARVLLSGIRIQRRQAVGFPPEARGNDVVRVVARLCPSAFIGHPDSAQAGCWIPARGTRE